MSFAKLNTLTDDVPNHLIGLNTANGIYISAVPGDNGIVDPFGRIRVSDPHTIFDSKQIFDNQPLFWDDQETSGGSTSSSHSVNEAATTISVGETTAGVRTRQTFMRFNYQPGKGQMILLTWGEFDTTTGINKYVGYFDNDNGLFFYSEEGTVGVCVRSKVTGSAVDTKVAQADWNLDTMDGTGPCGITLDFTKTQIGIIDFEWLGVGRVRMGFVVDGKIYYVHEILNANNLATVYMSTPNLPLRYSIENDGTGAADDFVHICSTVISEGGVQDLGTLRHAHNNALTSLSAGTIYAAIGIRLKSAALGSNIAIENISAIAKSANDQFHWMVVLNPTVAGTFTYSDVTNSTVQTATGDSTNTVSGGTHIDGGYVTTSIPALKSIPNAVRIGAAIDGTRDEMVLVVQPITNNINVDAATTWRELS